MPGLDPGIQEMAGLAERPMDCRVKPGNDEFYWFELLIP
jgi:hypothetical protein